MVRGQLKLADFGFSRFARAVQQHNNGSVPTELIQGFTDAYGRSLPKFYRLFQERPNKQKVLQKFHA